MNSLARAKKGGNREAAIAVRGLLSGGYKKSKHRPSQVQAYSILHYNTKLRPIVESLWELAKVASPLLGEDDRLKHRNDTLTSLYMDETEEVKKEVQDYIDAFDVDSTTESPTVPGEESLPQPERERLASARKRQV